MELVALLSLVPENVMTRPSPNKVTVGYQRPCAMFWGTSVKVLVSGSKNADLVDPVKAGSCCTVPPLMNTRPSGSTSMPLQNMSHDNLNCVITVVGRPEGA